MEAFLPLHTEVHRWKDRYKKVEVPLFSGYVFVQFERGSLRRQAVLKTTGVIRIVGFGQRDEPVPDEQIEALEHSEPRPETTLLAPITGVVTKKMALP